MEGRALQWRTRVERPEHLPPALTPSPAQRAHNLAKRLELSPSPSRGAQRAAPSRLSPLRPQAAPVAGSLLLSHPRLASPGEFFHRKVVLLTQAHSGARGLVLNSPARLSLRRALSERGGEAEAGYEARRGWLTLQAVIRRERRAAAAASAVRPPGAPEVRERRPKPLARAGEQGKAGRDRGGRDQKGRRDMEDGAVVTSQMLQYVQQFSAAAAEAGIEVQVKVGHPSDSDEEGEEGEAEMQAWAQGEDGCRAHLPNSAALLRASFRSAAPSARPPARLARLAVSNGGPLPGACLLHRSEGCGGQELLPGVFLARDDPQAGLAGALRALQASPGAGPPPRFFLGECEWEEGQLEAELARGEWLVASAEGDWLLQAAGGGGGGRRRRRGAGGAPRGANLWRAAMGELGGEFAVFSRLAGALSAEERDGGRALRLAAELLLLEPRKASDRLPGADDDFDDDDR